ILKQARLFYGLLGGTLVTATYVVHLKSGSYLNALMPAHAALALLGGLAFNALRAEPSASGSILQHRSRSLTVLVCCLCTVQFAALLHDPRSRVPTDPDRSAGMEFASAVAALTGRLFAPCTGYLAARVGRPTTAHEMALMDMLDRHDAPSNALRSMLAGE